MEIKILQLNIFQGKFLDEVLKFVKQNDIDILHFQEVTGGQMSQGGKYRYPGGSDEFNKEANEKHAGVDCFEEIKDILKMNGVLVKTTCLEGDKNSYMGNATFYKSSIKLLDYRTIWMKEYFEINKDFTDIPELSRASLISRFEIFSKKFSTVNTHFAWGPNQYDEPYKIEQAKILYKELANISSTLIITGDFNVTPMTETASMFNDFGKNLIQENHVVNTLNPRTHPAKVLFPPGIAVDYVIVSENINVKSFEVVDKTDLSDHFGLLTSFELN